MNYLCDQLNPIFYLISIMSSTYSTTSIQGFDTSGLPWTNSHYALFRGYPKVVLKGFEHDVSNYVVFGIYTYRWFSFICWF